MTNTLPGFLTTLLIACMLQSCISSKIQSNKNPEFNQKVSRIYVTVKGSSKKYIDHLTSDVLSGLKDHSVEAVAYYYDPLSLESENEVKDKINAYHPDIVMTVEQTEKRVSSRYYNNRNASVTGATLDIKLFVPGKENPVWRASLRSDSNLGIASASGNSAKKLITKLNEEGIIN